LRHNTKKIREEAKYCISNSSRISQQSAKILSKDYFLNKDSQKLINGHHNVVINYQK
jgi:hypothetical protein